MMKKILFILFLGITISAQCQEEESASNIGHHHISAFGGFTTDYKGKEGYKLGLEYEYRLTEKVGIGGMFDFTGRDFNIFAVSAGVDFYLFNFPLIPGISIGAKNYEKKWDPFLRLMLVYDFHVNDFSIGPMIMYDFFPNQKDIMSYGITIGYSLH